MEDFCSHSSGIYVTQSKPLLMINYEFHVLCLEYIIILWNIYILGMNLSLMSISDSCEKGLLVPNECASGAFGQLLDIWGTKSHHN